MKTRWKDKHGRPLCDGDRVILQDRYQKFQAVVTMRPGGTEQMFLMLATVMRDARLQPITGMQIYMPMHNWGRRWWSRRLERVEHCPREAQRNGMDI